jgi:hypothetical protein
MLVQQLIVLAELLASQARWVDHVYINVHWHSGSFKFKKKEKFFGALPFCFWLYLN